MTDPPARSRAERLRDTRAILEGGTDCWVATASAAGEPHLVPLSYGWQDGVVTLATPAAYRTVANLTERPALRLAFGGIRDVVLMTGRAVVGPVEGAPAALVDGFTRQAGFDPRRHAGYAFVVVTPRRVLAWRQENELEGRVLMRGGGWLDDEEERS